MATVNYFIRSAKSAATIYLRFKHGCNIDITRGTELLINPQDWNHKSKRPYLRSGDLKNLSTDLSELANSVTKQFNCTKVSEVNGIWLSRIIKDFRGVKIDEEIRSDLLVDCVQYLIDTASIRPNAKGSLGLSKSRVNSYKNLKKIIENFPNGSLIRLEQIDLQFGQKFLSWLLRDKNYSESYSLKKIDDLKTVCRNAEENGLQVNSQYKRIKGGKKRNEYIVFLTPQELNKIRALSISSKKLNNARKWLFLGCLVGQRGGDLLKISESNFVTRSGIRVIELEQQKTGKRVTIPILKETQNLLENGLPTTIPIQKFNRCLKEICKLAGIDDLITGYKFDPAIKRKVKGSFPKYELITSHVCRRTFATNLYGELPTPLIMQITAHSSEKEFLNYIGKGSYDFAKQISIYMDQKNNSSNDEVLKIV